MSRSTPSLFLGFTQDPKVCRCKPFSSVHILSKSQAADVKGPDEVHIQQQGKQELKRIQMIRERYGAIREKSGRLMNDPERAKL